jgi:hypothetical protein
VPRGSADVRLVRLTQVGEMVQRPGGRAVRFEAIQELHADEVAFEWRARYRLVPLVSASVIDRYVDGKGALTGRVFGVYPMMRASGADVDRGEAMRYLAELPWVPHAIESNPALEWRRIDRHSVEVATMVDGEPVAVRLDSNPEGDIVRALGDRPRLVGRRAVETRWIGEYSDYEVVGGVRVPTHAEFRWLLDEGPFAYWRGEVTALETE